MKTGRLRAGYRLVLIATTTLAAYLALILGTVVLLPARRVRVRWRNLCFRSWSRSVLRLLNAKIDTIGTPPKPPFFLVSNHLSYVDIALLASRVDGVFISKAEVADWPIVGHLTRAFGTLYVDRKRRSDIPRVIAEVESTLAGGQGVVLFPEGTSTAGTHVTPFRPSLLDVPARGEYPVSFASLSYRSDPGGVGADQAICWWGDMEFTSHFLGLLGLPGFTATLNFGGETIQASDRKVLAERLWAAVDRQFVPVGATSVGNASSPTSVGT